MDYTFHGPPATNIQNPLNKGNFFDIQYPGGTAKDGCKHMFAYELAVANNGKNLH